MALKPTITEYDSVYGGLRPNAGDMYTKLRTWILSLSSGSGGATNITYADLIIAMGAGTLDIGAWYLITDFRTREQIPATTDFNLGTVEPLLVLAISADNIGLTAYSDRFPLDEIIYSPNDVAFGADMGRILYRKDTRFNLSTWYDFRNCVFRRWDDGAGNFTVFFDNGNASQDFATFGTNNFNIEIAPSIVAIFGHALNNIIFGANCEEIFVDGSTNINFGINCENVKVGNRSTLITLGANCNNILIESTVSELTIGQNATNVKIGGFSTTVNVGLFSNAVTIGASCLDIEIAPGNTGIKLGDKCQNITSVNVCTDIEISENCTFIDLEDCVNINIANGCSNLTFISTHNFNILQGVTNRTINPLNIRCSGQHSQSKIDLYTDIDFTVESGAIGVLIQNVLPEGSFVKYCGLVGDGIVGNEGAMISIGIETDAPDGILPATSVLDAIWSGDIENTNAVELNPGIIPLPGTSGELDLIVTISGQDVTAGTLKIWTEILVKSI